MEVKEFGKGILDQYVKYNELWFDNKPDKGKRRSGPASGQYAEEIVKHFIKEHIGNRVEIRLVSGMICGDGKLSPQIDIIICSSGGEKNAIFDNGYGIVYVGNVYGVIEVKSLPRQIRGGIEQINAIRKCLVSEENKRIEYGILQICSSRSEKLQQSQNIGNSDIKICSVSIRLDKKIGKSRVDKKDDGVKPLRASENKEDYDYWEIDIDSIKEFLDWLDRLKIRNGS